MLPRLLVLAALLPLTALWLGDAHEIYVALFRLLGVPAFRFAFLDMHGEFAVIDCHRLGDDVYRSNPCDVPGRVHVYAPLSYRPNWLPISAADTPIVGFVLVAVLALRLRLLPIANIGRSTRILPAASMSPAVACALARGNVDLLMFVLAALAGWLAVRRGLARLLAIVQGLPAVATLRGRQ